MMTKGHGSTIVISVCYLGRILSSNPCYYNLQQFCMQALDVRDDITTLKKDLKQEITVSNYVSIILRNQHLMLVCYILAFTIDANRI